jgi:hypothetical protein
LPGLRAERFEPLASLGLRREFLRRRRQLAQHDGPLRGIPGDVGTGYFGEGA